MQSITVRVLVSNPIGALKCLELASAFALHFRPYHLLWSNTWFGHFLWKIQSLKWGGVWQCSGPIRRHLPKACFFNRWTKGTKANKFTKLQYISLQLTLQDLDSMTSPNISTARYLADLGKSLWMRHWYFTHSHQVQICVPRVCQRTKIGLKIV